MILDNDFEKNMWWQCFLKAIDLWQSDKRPEVYDDDCDPVEEEEEDVVSYLGCFADSCIEAYKVRLPVKQKLPEGRCPRCGELIQPSWGFCLNRECRLAEIAEQDREYEAKLAQFGTDEEKKQYQEYRRKFYQLIQHK